MFYTREITEMSNPRVPETYDVRTIYRIVRLENTELIHAHRVQNSDNVAKF